MIDASAQLGRAIGSFAVASASGMVSIDPDAAEAALKEIAAVRDELSALMDAARGNSTEVTIGANPVGVAMARKSMDRFDSSGDSFLHLVQKLYAQTEQAEAGLTQAIANYRDTDDGNAVKYRI